MKRTTMSTQLYSLAFLAVVAFIGVIGCGPPAGTPGTNNTAANNGNLVPPGTATPTPTPACDDNAINEELARAFTAAGNQNGPDGFDPIKNKVNFYSRNCEIYLWGYTKSL